MKDTAAPALSKQQDSSPICPEEMHEEMQKTADLLFEYLKNILYAPVKATLPFDQIPSEFHSLAHGLEYVSQCLQEQRLLGAELSKGNIHVALPSVENVIAAPLKAVHGSLSHLVWLMGRVSAGDYGQSLDFMNELSDSFNQMVKRLVKMAMTDDLTGLYNNVGFDEQAQSMISAAQEHYFVVMLDVNDFKRFNALYGAERGDKFLKDIATFLRQTLKEDELCARIHSDNFCCLLKGDSVRAVVERLNIDQRTFSTQITYRAQAFNYGVCEVTDCTVPVREMRDCARIAAQKAKSLPNQQVAVYDDIMAATRRREDEYLASFEDAFQKGEFKLFLQPQYSTATGQLFSAEALVRWIRPNGEIIYPDSFVRSFESNGQICALDFYIAEQVCAHLAARKTASLPVVPIAVNFSRVHLYDNSFVSHLTELVAHYQIEPSLLHVEITETAIMDGFEKMISNVEQLHAQGFVVAMDDFGSGASSLNMLKNVPLDILKLDKFFLNDFDTDPHGRSIIVASLNLAHQLGMKTVAEGVESKEEYEFLCSNGCDLIQGFYFEKAVPVKTFCDLLDHKYQPAHSPKHKRKK